MKKVITLCFAFFTALALSAQWSPVYTDASKTYYDADFPTALDGFVVGANTNGDYFILKTADGGISWTEIALPPGFFNQIAMYSATSGYVSAGGGSASLLYTNDAFATTTSHPLDGSFGTTGLDVINDSTGFYMNNGSRFRSFGQYGDTINILMDTLTGSDAFDVADDSTVYVGNGIHLLKSTDAGATWFCVNSTLTEPIGYSSLVFINADTGYYLRDGGPGIWQTIDGGVSFQLIDNYYAGLLDARGPCCVALFGLSTVHWSSDYGQNWTQEALGMTNSSGAYLTPLGDCYVTNNTTGEIRKRQLPLSVRTTSSAFSGISVFPNPANDLITVSFANVATDPVARLVLVNTLGEAVLEITLPRDGGVSIAGLAAGMYCYQVWTSDELIGTGLISKQ